MQKYWLVIGAAALGLALIGGTLLMDRSREGSEDGTEKPAASAPAAEATGAPQPPAGATAVPQREPVALEQVEQPPPSTVAFIEPDKFTKDSRYKVVFVPYGIGPGAGQGAALVISIEKSTPQGDIAKPFKFEGMNALVDTSRLTPEQAVTKGGTYEGVLTLVEQQGMLVPSLSDVKAR